MFANKYLNRKENKKEIKNYADNNTNTSSIFDFFEQHKKWNTGEDDKDNFTTEKINKRIDNRNHSNNYLFIIVFYVFWILWIQNIIPWLDVFVSISHIRN